VFVTSAKSGNVLGMCGNQIHSAHPYNVFTCVGYLLTWFVLHLFDFCLTVLRQRMNFFDSKFFKFGEF